MFAQFRILRPSYKQIYCITDSAQYIFKMPARQQSNFISPPVDEIIHDPLTQLSRKYWALNDSNVEQYDSELINNIYNKFIKGSGFSRRKLMILEFTRYLENYLWKHFNDSTMSIAHVMSIVAVVNEKARQKINPFQCFIGNNKYINHFFVLLYKIAIGGVNFASAHDIGLSTLDVHERDVDVHARENDIFGREIDFNTREHNITHKNLNFSNIRESIKNAGNFNNLSINNSNLTNLQNLTPNDFSFLEHAQIVEFFIAAVNNIEINFIREQLAQIVGISIWTNILPNRLKFELENNSIYKKLYRKYNLKVNEFDEQKKAQTLLKSSFISKYIGFFIQTLCEIDKELFDDNDKLKPILTYIHFFCFLLIELESLLSTRRFFHVLADDHHVMVRMSCSYLYQSGKDPLFKELWEILKFYSKIEIDELRGVELNANQLLERHYQELTQLQKIAFTEFKNEMSQFYLEPVYRIDSRESLMDHFSKLSTENLNKFAHYCNIVNYEKGKFTDRSYLIELLTFKYETVKTLLERVNTQPLYPDEKMLWYDSKIPEEDWAGEDCLPLPKLNLQFLTLNDYLWRNFTLFLLESTYCIKSDIEDAITRLKPWMNELGDTNFSGWARMALPLKEFAVVTVGSTDVSTSNPKFVHADVIISTRMRESFKNEWTSLRRYDPIFLLQIQFENIGSILHQEEFFPRKFGIVAVRGAEIIGLINEEGKVIEEGVEYKPKGPTCSYRIALDPNQYKKDIEAGENGDSVYNHLNVILRRKPKENNFKAVLETIKMLMNTECLIPEWLGDIFLGYGDPSSAHPSNLKQDFDYVDYFDTFVDSIHIKASFPDHEVEIIRDSLPYWRLYFNGKSIKAESYIVELPLYDRQKKVKLNQLRYTSKQIEAISMGIQNGLTLIVGPPGTGKTDVAVQIISTIFNTYPEQRTLIVTHSNQALNHIFEKIVNLNVDDLKLIRLGHGEEDMTTKQDFGRRGRVDQVLARRLELIQKVIDLQKSMNIEGMFHHTCETAANFFKYQIKPRINAYLETVNNEKTVESIFKEFPFTTFINTAIGGEIFPKTTFEENYNLSLEYIDYVDRMFSELMTYRPYELLRTVKDRSNYMVSKTCRIIAMTCVHAALKRKDLVELKFQYDNIIMEESAQILEVETFIPLLLQNPYEGANRLKRIILIGDHNQLPPIIRNPAFQKYCNMEQSLFTRFIRLGVPYVELDQQGRCRPSICHIFDWRYHNLKSLPLLLERPEFQLSNSGLLFEYQLINVEDFNGVGESEPTRHFIQNLGEAEYAVSLYIYMRICGYPANKISILTTYNGQKNLIRDIIKKKCSSNPLLGEPKHVSTVDRFQGQQNDYIILSLVRTKTIGYIRDVRRLIVAMSRARLGLYVFARVSLFSCCHELVPSFQKLLQFPTKLHIVLNETNPSNRPQNSHNSVPAENINQFEDVVHFTKFLHSFYLSFAEYHQKEEKRLEEERKRNEELQRIEYEKYVKQMEQLAGSTSGKNEGLIKNEVVGVIEEDD